MNPPSSSMLTMLVPYGLIFLIFYFLVIRPQKDQQKKLADMKNNLKKNDQVVMAGGMHGTVVLVKDKTVVVRVDDNVKIEFDKEAVTTVVTAKT
ncbi:MAG: preprotein translocase subunit YajC [Candidatus Omnitrophica bacterium]|nr:preprotein translocase subunit YajC [Candidatus Omnitrophota bacterium]